MKQDDIVDTLLRLASNAHCAATRIYNIIREVGRGELTADNALHQLVEDYKNLHDLGHDIGEASDYIEKSQKEGK